MRIVERLAEVREIVEFNDTPEYQKALESLYANISKKSWHSSFTEDEKHFRGKRLLWFLADPSSEYDTRNVDIVCSRAPVGGEKVHGLPVHEAMYALSVWEQTVELVAVNEYWGDRSKFYTLQFRTLDLGDLRTRSGIIKDYRKLGLGIDEIKKADEWVKSWQEIPFSK